MSQLLSTTWTSEGHLLSGTPASTLRLMHKARKVLLGNTPTAQAPTPSVLNVGSVGLLYFLNEKQATLHRAIGGAMDLSDSLLEPLRLLVEFLSFAVAGLIVEAERIDETAIRLQQEINDVALELRKLDLELQYRKERTGTTVSRILAQHYKARVTVPLVHASDQLDPNSAEELRELSDGIFSLRETLNTLKKRRASVVAAQRLLHGPGSPIPAVEAEAIVTDLPMLVTFRKAHHAVKDALLKLPPATVEDDVPALVSLLEFVLHVEVGLRAATDDLDAGIMQVKKHVAAHEKEVKEERLNALDSRNKQLSTSAMKYNEALRRGLLRGDGSADGTNTVGPLPVNGAPLRLHVGGQLGGGSNETDEFLSLYCS